MALECPAGSGTPCPTVLEALVKKLGLLGEWKPVGTNPVVEVARNLTLVLKKNAGADGKGKEAWVKALDVFNKGVTFGGRRGSVRTASSWRMARRPSAGYRVSARSSTTG